MRRIFRMVRADVSVPRSEARSVAEVLISCMLLDWAGVRLSAHLFPWPVGFAVAIGITALVVWLIASFLAEATGSAPATCAQDAAATSARLLHSPESDSP